jgi:hypothetical protein
MSGSDGMGMMMSSMMMTMVCCVFIVIAAGGAYWFIKNKGIGGGGGGMFTGVEEEVGESLGKDPTMEARCPVGSHVQGINAWTGDWNDVAGVYAECLDPKSGVAVPLYDAGQPGVEKDTNVAGKSGLDAPVMDKIVSGLSMGLINDGGKGFQGIGIKDATTGFTQLNVVYNKDDGFIYDMAGKTTDGRTFYKLQQGGYKVGNASLAGSHFGIGLITRKLTQDKIKSKWSQYNTFVRKHAPNKHFPLEFGPTGDIVKGEQPDITSWSQGCAQNICHKRSVCPPGKVITGIDVSIGNGVVRGLRAVCGKSDWA